jgi:hypothetical protein
MKAIEIDISEFNKAMDKAKFTPKEVMDILVSGGAHVATVQKLIVPTDTHDTQNSIAIRDVSSTEISIGPTTDYAPFIEYGTSNPNYPIQPFVVPSAVGQNKAKVLRIIEHNVKSTLRGKGLL